MRSLRGAWCVLLALQTARSDAFCPPPGVVPGVQPLGHGRRAPDFLVVGTVKGGTSALGCAAEAHPSIGMLRIEAPIYESHFFNGNASFYSSWDRGQAWYERSLDGLKAHDMTAVGVGGTRAGPSPSSHATGVARRREEPGLPLRPGGSDANL